MPGTWGLLAGLALLAAGEPVPVALCLNGRQVMLPTPALNDGGKVLVPVKGVFDRLGAKVSWSAEAARVIADYGGSRLAFAVGSPRATLNGVEVELGASPRQVGEYTLVPVRALELLFAAQVRWDAAGRAVLVTALLGGEALPVRVRDLEQFPFDWQGRLVQMTGEYRGWTGSPLHALTAGGPPVSWRDWVLRDGTGEVYCRGGTAVPPPFALGPYESLGRRLNVTGVVKIAEQGFAFIEPRQLAATAAPEGIVCSVETDRRVYRPGDEVHVRITVLNPFAEPITVHYAAGEPPHEVVVYGEGGEEVWQSSAGRALEGQPGEDRQLEPDESFLLEEVWPLGPTLRFGRYHLVAQVGANLTAYAHRLLVTDVPRR